MSVRDTTTVPDEIAGDTPPGINFPLTEFVLRCPASDAAKPIAQRDYSLYLFAPGVLDGADKRIPGLQRTRTFTMAQLKALPTNARAQLVSIVNLAESALTLAHQTHVQDFNLD